MGIMPFLPIEIFRRTLQHQRMNNFSARTSFNRETYRFYLTNSAFMFTLFCSCICCLLFSSFSSSLFFVCFATFIIAPSLFCSPAQECGNCIEIPNGYNSQACQYSPRHSETLAQKTHTSKMNDIGMLKGVVKFNTNEASASKTFSAHKFLQ